MTGEIPPAIAATRSEFGSPIRTRASTSRPKRSVPSGFCRFGSRKMSKVPLLSGLVAPMASRTSSGLSSAMAIRTIRIIAPSRNLPLERQIRANAIAPPRREKCLHRQLPRSAHVLDARVEERQAEIDDQVGGEDHEDQQDDDPLRGVEVFHRDGIDQQIADSR